MVLLSPTKSYFTCFGMQGQYPRQVLDSSFGPCRQVLQEGQDGGERARERERGISMHAQVARDLHTFSKRVVVEASVWTYSVYARLLFLLLFLTSMLHLT